MWSTAGEWISAFQRGAVVAPRHLPMTAQV
jgi:hypothetical protein